MRSRNEFNRCDSRSYSGPAQPRTRHSSPRYAGEQGVELIDLPPCTAVPSSQACPASDRTPRESTSYARGNSLAKFWEEQVTVVVDGEASRDHLGTFKPSLIRAYLLLSRFQELLHTSIHPSIHNHHQACVNHHRIGTRLARKFYPCPVSQSILPAARILWLKGHAPSLPIRGLARDFPKAWGSHLARLA